jgi:lipid II:glycine glycyltransferase (peptidoglycan interpeptide bridge formation enzyme)
MKNDKIDFIQVDSTDREFLQSEEWRNFQESAGYRTFNVSENNFSTSIIEHELPIVGRYFYIPRGPVLENPKSEILNSKQIPNSKLEIKNFLNKIIDLAKKENAGWIRVEPLSEKSFYQIKKNIKYKIAKAPHDMQPKEVFVIDITKSEEELLAQMKSKTRYNIKIAQKRGVSVYAIINGQDAISKSYIDKFIELVKITAKRDGIVPHLENYYRKMFERISGKILKVYIAEYKNRIIAANFVINYGDTATYLHGVSDNEHRNVMAPYLLQWQAILDAKKLELKKYDFGGIKTGDDNSWTGITKFKTGFSPGTQPVEFPGSYDIIIKRNKYVSYKILRFIKNLAG